MITLFTPDCKSPDQDFYDDLVNSLQFSQFKCPCCHHSGTLTIHGYYTRHLKTPDSLIPLRICRVKCSDCSSTHALLPSSIVPYSQIRLSDQAEILSNYENGTSQNSFMDRNPLIDENNIKAVIRSYVRHWLQKLRSETISMSCMPSLVSDCFLHFGRQFMQIKITANILFSSPT